MSNSFLSNFVFISFIAVFVYYFFNQNNDLKPETYALPFPPKLKGPLKPNNKLTEGTYILKGEIKGPESLYIDGKDIDTIYTGTADGKIVKIINGTIAKSFILMPQGEIDCDGTFQTQPNCGRPMGIKRFDKNRLIVADAYFGLFLVDLELDSAEQILKPSTNENPDEIGSVKCAFFNDIAITDNDTVAFSCSSTRWGVGLAFHMLLEHQRDGKIYHYKISTKSIEILAENFSFCNGLELNKAKTVLFIAETGMARIWKLPLKTTNPKPELFLENLPGLPDNIRATSSGTFLVGLAVHRSYANFSVFDFMGPHSFLRKLFIEWIPESYINEWMPKMTTEYGFVIEFDESGKIVGTFQDPTGKTLNFISEAVESEGHIYLGSFKDDYIAKISKK